MESVEDLWNQIEGKPKRLVTAIVIGCGQRGQNYSQFSLELPNWLKLVAVADPLQHRREKIAKSAGIYTSFVSTKYYLKSIVLIFTFDNRYQ